MWLSANMVISSVAIGVLGPQLFFMSVSVVDCVNCDSQCILMKEYVVYR